MVYKCLKYIVSDFNEYNSKEERRREEVIIIFMRNDNVVPQITCTTVAVSALSRCCIAKQQHNDALKSYIGTMEFVYMFEFRNINFNWI